MTVMENYRLKNSLTSLLFLAILLISCMRHVATNSADTSNIKQFSLEGHEQDSGFNKNSVNSQRSSDKIKSKQSVIREQQGNTLRFQEKGRDLDNLEQRYAPTWESIDSRPIPQWYDDAKIGIFLHWGVFSVPSYVGAWFWYYWKGPKPRQEVVDFMNKNYKPDFTYADFAPMFTAEFYNPDQWADIFKASGAQYVVLTTKHHEGFCNWPTNHSFNWNAMDVGPKRDLVGDLAVAVRKQGLRFGTYHSLYEWFHPLYIQDVENNFTTQDFVRAKTLPELYELVNTYKPDIVWSDGCDGPDYYWNSTEFLAWLYNDRTTNENIKLGSQKCGYASEYVASLRNKSKQSRSSREPESDKTRKFEDPTTVDKKAWEFRRDLHLSDVHTMEDITTMIAQVVSCGGNLLLNVGPTKEGVIVPIFEERLRQMGQWLAVNGEAIYATRPWTYQNDSIAPDVWYTSTVSEGETNVYAILLKWPASQTLILEAPIPNDDTVVTLLGYPTHFQWIHHRGSGIEIALPVIPANEMPCKWAWVVKLTDISN